MPDATALSAADTTWHGRRLLVARSLWIVIVVAALALYVVSIPLQVAHREILCGGSACPYDQISASDMELLQQAGLSLQFTAVYFVAVNAIVMLLFVVVAGIIFWRRSDEGVSLFASLVLVTFGVSVSSPLTTVTGVYPALLLPAQLFEILGSLGIGIFFLVFPDGRFVPRWTVWLVPLAALHEALRILDPALLGADLGSALLLGTSLGVQIYRYVRVSNAIQRQQTKWAVAGMLSGVAGFAGVMAWEAIVWGGRPPGLANLVGTTALFFCLLLVPILATPFIRTKLKRELAMIHSAGATKSTTDQGVGPGS